jgi:hypothetical protein
LGTCAAPSFSYPNRERPNEPDTDGPPQDQGPRREPWGLPLLGRRLCRHRHVCLLRPGHPLWPLRLALGAVRPDDPVRFILLCIKYAEVTWRYPEGGGVVNVSSQALHPFAGLLDALFILVDYYLTAALSALSGVLYIAVVNPHLTAEVVVLAATVGALIALGVLNFMGIKESARTR